MDSDTSLQMASSSDEHAASDSDSTSTVIIRQNSMSLGILAWIILPYISIAVLVMSTYSYSKDGEWSNWGDWSECHGGLRVRSRVCNNPAPSIFGQYCQGGSQMYELCNLDSCTVSNRNGLKQEVVEQFDQEKRTVPTEHEHLKPNAEHPDEMDSMQETYTESPKYEEFIDEVRETLKQNERTALSEKNAISSSFQALKTKTAKLMNDHKKLISEENDAFKNQITDIVKGLEKKTNMSESELVEKVKREIKSFENKTQLITKEVTAMSNDFNEYKKEILEHVEEAIGDSLKRLSNKHSVSNRNGLKQEVVEQLDKEKRTAPTEHEHLKPNALLPVEMDSMQETYTESSKYEEFINEVRETLKQNERTALSETNEISSSFQTLKTKTEKVMNDHKKLISKENDAFKNQITDIVKGLEKKTNMSESELEKVKREIKSFENLTQLITKEVTAMSNDFNEYKKEIIEQVEVAIGDSFKRLSNKHSDKMVAFTAYGVSGTSNLVFPHIIDNIGNGYDIATGKFTCTIPGIYFFSFQISKMYKALTDLVECFIYRNQAIVVGVREDPAGTNAGSDNGGYSISVSAALHLDTKDIVLIGGCTGISAVYTDNRSSFTGILVRPDN